MALWERQWHWRVYTFCREQLQLFVYIKYVIQFKKENHNDEIIK